MSSKGAVQVLEEKVRPLVGQPVRRKEDPTHIKGLASFVDDIRLADVAYLASLRSPYAHAKIKRIVASKAEGMPGVLLVLTGKDVVDYPLWIHTIIPGLRTTTCYSLAEDRVRYVGEAVASVVATDTELAKDAIDTIEVEYEPLPVVIDSEKALAPEAPLLYEEWGNNIMLDYRFKDGDVDRCFREAEYVFTERISSHRYSGAPMEPRAYLASYDRSTGMLTLWASTQKPHVLRTILANTLRMPESLIRVIQPDVGGAFGIKEPTYPEELLVCLASMRLNRPVKYLEDRNEGMIAQHQAREQTHYIEAAVTKDGKVTAIRDRLIANLGIYYPVAGPSSIVTTTRFLTGCYKIRNYEVQIIGVATNKPPYGAYRGFGKDAASFVIERLMDIIARGIKMDPVDLRMRNLIQPHEMPYRSVTGHLYDSGDYPESLRRAISAIGYHRIKAQQKELREKGKYIGVGISVVLEPAASHFPGTYTQGMDGATVRLEPTGTLTILAGVTSTGTGHQTVWSQVAADELGLDYNDIYVIEGDSAVCPYGFGSWASRSVVVGATSILMACRKLKEKLLKFASLVLNTAPDELALARARVYMLDDPSKDISIRELASIVIQNKFPFPPDLERSLEATAYYFPQIIESVADSKGRRNAYATYGNTTNAAVVEVDADTGAVSILRYLVVHDCGKVLNPLIVDGQVHGGLAQGIGGALLEENAYSEDGQPLATTFMDYMLPTALDIPNIEIERMETPSPFVPLGAKGVGEGGAEGVAATLCNAVEDALAPFEVKITKLPLSPEEIWNLLHKAKDHKPSA